ncbi:hypothetical protein COL940_013968 [Colletotrichum noveboracense]|nr:hypothetical protein COL940_013968 [Colletotrichum noveboracense]
MDFKDDEASKNGRVNFTGTHKTSNEPIRFENVCVRVRAQSRQFSKDVTIDVLDREPVDEGVDGHEDGADNVSRMPEHESIVGMFEIVLGLESPSRVAYVGVLVSYI